MATLKNSASRLKFGGLGVYLLVYKALHDAMTAYLVDAYDRPTSTPVVFHGPRSP